MDSKVGISVHRDRPFRHRDRRIRERDRRFRCITFEWQGENAFKVDFENYH